MNAAEKVGVAVLIVMALFTVYVAFVLLPVMFYTEAECLRAGYPKAHITIGLERYCTTLDGAVTVRVTRQ